MDNLLSKPSMHILSMQASLVQHHFQQHEFPPSAAELANMILAATFPTMPRLWAFIGTGDRNAQRYISNERRSAPYPPRKTRQPTHVKQSSSPEDNIPLKGSYTELQSSAEERRKAILGMQILKTEEYDVTTQIAAMPQMP